MVSAMLILAILNIARYTLNVRSRKWPQELLHTTYLWLQPTIFHCFSMTMRDRHTMYKMHNMHNIYALCTIYTHCTVRTWHRPMLNMHAYHACDTALNASFILWTILWPSNRHADVHRFIHHTRCFSEGTQNCPYWPITSGYQWVNIQVIVL